MATTLLETPRVGLRERQRVARDAQILQAAFDLIAERGYEAMTMETVAERVGISRQTLYHHFANKEAIALGALLSLMEQGIRSIAVIDPALPPFARLERVVRWLLQRRFSPALASFVRARPSLVPLKAHPDYQRAFERRAEAITEIVEAAQRDGTVREEIPARLIVQMLLGLVSEAHYDEMIEAGQVTPEAVTDTITGLFLRGVRAGSEERR